MVEENGSSPMGDLDSLVEEFNGNHWEFYNALWFALEIASQAGARLARVKDLAQQSGEPWTTWLHRLQCNSGEVRRYLRIRKRCEELKAAGRSIRKLPMTEALELLKPGSAKPKKQNGTDNGKRIPALSRAIRRKLERGQLIPHPFI
jgi:hypothetical protein